MSLLSSSRFSKLILTYPYKFFCYMVLEILVSFELKSALHFLINFHLCSSSSVNPSILYHAFSLIVSPLLVFILLSGILCNFLCFQSIMIWQAFSRICNLDSFSSHSNQLVLQEIHQFWAFELLIFFDNRVSSWYRDSKPVCSFAWTFYWLFEILICFRDSFDITACSFIKYLQFSCLIKHRSVFFDK